jgi:hypothetical protein
MISSGPFCPANSALEYIFARRLPDFEAKSQKNTCKKTNTSHSLDKLEKNGSAADLTVPWATGPDHKGNPEPPATAQTCHSPPYICHFPKADRLFVPPTPNDRLPRDVGEMVPAPFWQGQSL